MRFLLLSLSALLLLSGCGPETKEEFWARFNVLMDEEQGRSTALFQRSAEGRAEQMDKFVTEYYEDFAPMMSQEEKAEFFGKVAVFYLVRSGVIPRAAAADVPPTAADSLARNANEALRQLGETFRKLGEALPDSARLHNAGRELLRTPEHIHNAAEAVNREADPLPTADTAVRPPVHRRTPQ